MKRFLAINSFLLFFSIHSSFAQGVDIDSSELAFHKSIIDVYYAQYSMSESALFQEDDFSFLKFEIFKGVEGGWVISNNLSASVGYDNFSAFDLPNSYFIKGKYGIVSDDMFHVAGVALLTKGLNNNSLFAMGQLMATYGDKNTNFSIGFSAALDRNRKEHVFLHLAGSFRIGTISFVTDNVMDVDRKLASSLLIRIISKNIIFDVGVNSDLKGTPVPIVSAGLSF